LFLRFLYDRTCFRCYTYTTDRPCVILSAGKISAIYIKYWLRKRNINLTHSHVVATKTYTGWVKIFFQGGISIKGPSPLETFCHLEWFPWAEIFRDEWSWRETLLVKISARLVLLNLISSWFIGDFWPSGESTKLYHNTRYSARVGFKLKPMSVRNFCPNRIFIFRTVHFLWAF
jgi:hypothetical protein